MIFIIYSSIAVYLRLVVSQLFGVEPSKHFAPIIIARKDMEAHRRLSDTISEGTVEILARVALGVIGAAVGVSAAMKVAG